MSWTEARFYGQLRAFFAYKWRAVKSKEGTPTAEQLASYIKTIKTQIDGILGKNRPAKAIDPIAKAYAGMGWDWGHNKQKGEKAASKEDLIKMLETLGKAFYDIERECRQKIAEALEPTEHDLENLDNGVDKLWELDAKNRMKPGVDYELDLQKGKRSREEGDKASRPLFKFVKKESLDARPTYKAFLALLDNYERAVGVAEVETAQEKKEIRTFLATCLQTNVMKYAHKWLAAKGKVSKDPKEFFLLLQKLWFEMYKRDYNAKRPDSSGFEHVFVGEERNGKIVGCHNWLQLWREEQLGNMNYLGYIYPYRPGMTRNDNESHLVTIQFEWKDGKDDNTFELKPVSTSWVGVSPEFELALYTMVFLAGDEENVMDVGPYMVNIKCYTIRRDRVNFLSTSFPEDVPPSEKERNYQASY